MAQLSLDKAQTNLEHAQISTIIAVNPVTLPGPDGEYAGGHSPQVQQDHR